MRRLFFLMFWVALLLQVYTMQAQERVIFYNFNTDPYISVTSKSDLLTCSDIALSSGTVGKNKTTTSFPNKPYIEGRSWSAASAATAKNFYIDVTVQEGYEFTLSKVKFDSYRTSSGAKNFSLFVDGVEKYSTDIKTTVHVIDAPLDLKHSGTFRIELRGWNGGGGTWRIDELEVFGSIAAEADTEKPTLNGAELLSKNKVKLLFSKELNAITALNVANYNIDGINPASAAFSDAAKNAVDLTFTNDFATESEQTIHVSNVSDIADNVIDATSTTFSYEALKLLSAVVNSSRELHLTFSAEPQLASANLASNYTIAELSLQANSIEQDAVDKTKFVVTFDSDFEQDRTLNLAVNVNDKLGDAYAFSSSFQFSQVDRGEVVLNELMVDVNPAPEHLPVAEYIELKNTTNFAIDLEGYKLEIGSKTLVFPATTIAANGYAIVAKSSFETVFAALATFVPLDVSSLSSSGTTVVLKRDDDEIISKITYNSDTFADNDKDGGGWSLERIDATNNCADDSENWRATTDYKGGTPGRKNSVEASLTTSAFEVALTKALTAKSIRVQLSNKVDAKSLSLSNFNATEGIGQPIAIKVSESEKELELSFGTAFPAATPFSLEINKIKDLCGSELTTIQTITYTPLQALQALPKSANQLQIVFSEPLDPSSVQTSDFVVNNEIGAAASVFVDPSKPYIVHVEFAVNFVEKQSYDLQMSTLNDTNGDEITNQTLQFSYPSVTLEPTIEILSATALELTFTEALKESCADLQNFILEGNVLVSASFVDEGKAKLLLKFQDDFLADKELDLELRNFFTATGQAINELELSFTYQELKLNSAEIKNEKTVLLQFNHFNANASMLSVSGYQINDMGNPVAVQLADGTTADVELIFENRLPVNSKLNLQISLSNSYGFEFQKSVELTYNKYPRGAVVFNELMFDPSPAPRALPKAKYIELYNTTDETVNLHRWKLYMGTSEIELPEFELEAGAYLLLCAEGNTNLFTSYGAHLGILSDSKLTISGTELVLTDAWENTIDALTYNETYYADEEKEDGGWAIERLDARNLCARQDNWRASVDARGGTPNQKNSVETVLSDTDAPSLLSHEVLSAKMLRLEFDQELNTDLAGALDSYWFNNAANSVQSVQILEEGKVLLLHLTEPLQANKEYELLLDPLTDWCGNTSNETVSFTYTPLHVVDHEIISGTQVRILFSEALNPATCIPANFTLSPEGIQPAAANLSTSNPSEVFLVFENALEYDVAYTLQCISIENSYNSVAETLSIPLLLHTVAAQEVVINEVLTYPETGQTRFLELFNRSNYAVDISDLALKTYSDGVLDKTLPLSTTSRILKPDSFIVISSEPEKLKEVFTTYDAVTFLTMSNFPSYDKESASIVVANDKGQTVDSLEYQSSWHMSALRDKARGVSLERLDPNRPTNSEFNWQSAGETIGFATPGLQNSQYNATTEASGLFSVDKKIFTPDADAHEDYLLVNFAKPESETIANVTVYNASGQLIKRIAKNLLLSATGVVKWDGTDETGAKAPVGVYLIFVECIAENGEVHKEKISCVLGAKL